MQKKNKNRGKTHSAKPVPASFWIFEKQSFISFSLDLTFGTSNPVVFFLYTELRPWFPPRALLYLHSDKEIALFSFSFQLSASHLFSVLSLHVNTDHFSVAEETSWRLTADAHTVQYI